MLHCAYASAADGAILASAWTDADGELLQCDAQLLLPKNVVDSASFRSPESDSGDVAQPLPSSLKPVSVQEAVANIGRRARLLVQGTSADWCVVVCRVGVPTEEELAALRDMVTSLSSACGNIVSLSVCGLSSPSPLQVSRGRTAMLSMRASSEGAPACALVLPISTVKPSSALMTTLLLHVSTQPSERHALTDLDELHVAATVAEQLHALSWLGLDMAQGTRHSNAPFHVLVLARLLAAIVV